MHRLTSATIAMSICCAAAAGAAEPLDDGLASFRRGAYREALMELGATAERGDARAQEILGFMYLHGPSLYGAAVPQDRDRAMHWFGRAARAGREVSQHMMCVLTGRPADTVVDRSACASGAEFKAGLPATMSRNAVNGRPTRAGAAIPPRAEESTR